MTKVYLANDEYEVYFDSGKMVILSEDDIDELVAESSYVEDLKEDIETANKGLTELKKVIQKHNTPLQELEDLIPEISRTKTRDKIREAYEMVEASYEEIDDVMSDYR